MDPTAVYHWFFTITAFVYGLMIGSFLNVCIYRLPPRLFVFDDFLLKEESDFSYYYKRLLEFLRIKKAEKPPLVEPSLYVEGVFMLIIHPETVTHLAAAHTFNLFRLNNPSPITIVKPRSFCPNCGNMIRWWMNIPVLSYLFLGGKCYFCHQKISPRYMINELITGFLWGLLFYKLGIDNIPAFLFYSTLISICIVVFYIDLEHWLIMDEITLPFTLLAIIFSIFIPYKFFMPHPEVFSFLELENIIPMGILDWVRNISVSSPAWIFPRSLISSITGAIIGVAAFWSIGVVGTVLFKRDAMGGGDVKFAMLMGAFLGPVNAGMAFFISVLVGTAILVPMLLINRKTGKDQVPFGCFLTISTIIVIFFGDRLIDFYFNWPNMVFGL